MTNPTGVALMLGLVILCCARRRFNVAIYFLGLAGIISGLSVLVALGILLVSFGLYISTPRVRS